MRSRSRSNLGFLFGIVVLLASSAGIGLLITLMTADARDSALVAQWTPPVSPTAALDEAVASAGTSAEAGQKAPSATDRPEVSQSAGSLGTPAPLRPTPLPLRTPAPLSAAATLALQPTVPAPQPTATVSDIPTSPAPPVVSAPTLPPPPTPAPETAATAVVEPSPPAGPLRQIVSAIGAAVAPRPPQPLRAVSPPDLTGPPQETPQQGVVTFTWNPTAPLPEDAAYEVVWWVEGQDPATARGVAPPTRDTFLSINLDVMYQANLFGSGNVYWTVIIVRPDPYTRLTLPALGQSRRFVYQPPLPPPTPTPEPPPEQPKP